MHVYVAFIYGEEYKKWTKNRFKYLSFYTTGVSIYDFNELEKLIHLIILEYYFKTNDAIL